jgi:hypothetical protein
MKAILSILPEVKWTKFPFPINLWFTKNMPESQFDSSKHKASKQGGRLYGFTILDRTPDDKTSSKTKVLRLDVPGRE